MEPKDPEKIITVFAKTNFRNQEVPFGIKTDDRRRHMYLIGKTGMGKTTVMENMAIQDIRNGHGVAFLDPHGDSIGRILDSIPSNRVNDVIYFNPADLEFPVAFNILEAVDTKYKHLVASGLMGVFTKIWANLWSARMEYILNNTILALLDSPGNTLLGITRMYVDKKYRKKIVDNVKDPMVKAFWTDEFANYNEKYRTEAIAPIQNKVGQFLSSGIIRNIVGQPKSTIDLREIMDKKKILIMDLSKGKVGEDNSALLGAMIVTKLQLAAMSRTDIPEHERKDFYLYVDEFQNFATDSFATILSEARKYRLNLIVGHQYIGQLVQERNTKVRDAIFGNVGTLVVFRVGAEDAEFLVKEFEPIFTEVDIVNLPKYHILLKLMINGVASDPFSAVTVPASPSYVTDNGEKTIKVSRERYSNPVAEVEEKISRWMGSDLHQESAMMINEEKPEGEESQEKTESAPDPVRQPKTEIPAQLAFVSEPEINTKIAETEVEIPQKKFVDKPRNSFARSQTAHAHDHNRSQTQRSHNAPHHDHGRSQQTKNSSKNPQSQKNTPIKKANPIWDKVADLHHQRTTQVQQQNQESLGKIIESSFQSSPPVPKPEPDIQKPSPDQHRTVIKPGESHTM